MLRWGCYDTRSYFCLLLLGVAFDRSMVLGWSREYGVIGG